MKFHVNPASAPSADHSGSETCHECFEPQSREGAKKSLVLNNKDLCDLGVLAFQVHGRRRLSWERESPGTLPGGHTRYGYLDYSAPEGVGSSSSSKSSNSSSASKMKFRVSTLLTVGLVVLALSRFASAQTDTSCEVCHANPDMFGTEQAAIVEGFGHDIHKVAGISCQDCHGGNPDPALAEDPAGAMDPDFRANPYRGAPKRTEIPAFCGKCHSDPDYMRQFRPDLRVDQVQEYWTSRHGKALKNGDGKVATCVDCHGVHGIRSASDPLSRVFPKNVAETCSHCHSDPDRMDGYRLDNGQPIPTSQYALWQESVHAKAMLEKQDLSAPTCNDCHGNHGAVPPGVEAISFVCGQCHGREATLFRASPKLEGFRTHESFAEDGQPLDCRGCHDVPEDFKQIEPVHSLTECSTCHGNHAIVRPTISMLGPLPDTPCDFCHGSAADSESETANLSSERPQIVSQSLGRLLKSAEQEGVAKEDQYDWLVQQTLQLPEHTLGAGPDGKPKLRTEFGTLFEKLRIGTMRRPGLNGEVKPGAPWRVRCNQCHDPNSPDNVGTQTASAFVDKFGRLSRSTAAAERALLKARRGGVETRDALTQIEAALEADIQLQVLVHTFSADESGQFAKKYEEGMKSSEAGLNEGRAALDELKSRRTGLLVALVFIGLTLIGLYAKIRQVG